MVHWVRLAEQLEGFAHRLASELAALSARALQAAKSCLAGEHGCEGYRSEVEMVRWLMQQPETAPRLAKVFRQRGTRP
jgi:hypothetical protein